MSGSSDSSSTSAVFCAVCGQDISLLSVAMRNSHSEQCLDMDTDIEIVPQQNYQSIDFDALMLDRLPDCPVCASAWPSASMNSRAKHVSECAKRFSVSSKDLIDLISLFRESIDSMSESSSVNASSNAEKLRLKPGGIRDPSTDRFIKAFTPPPKKKSAFGTKKSKNTKGKSKDLAIGNNGMTTKLKNTGQALQTCISESVGKIQSIGSKSPAASRANGLPKSEPSFSRSSSSMSFEIPEDEDFQSTKVRVSLQQTRIAIGKKRKLQQDVLDELGDDLNEAKALSLSLKRGPDQLLSKSVQQRRRDAGSKSVDTFGSSDILSSKDAQSLIRHRALELERIDKEVYERIPYTLMSSQPQSSKNDADVESSRLHAASKEEETQLWSLASLESDGISDSRFSYCPMFENFKMKHWKHESTEECLEHALDHILQSLAQINSDSSNDSASINETSLRNAYITLIKAARESFIRKSASFRCASWLADSRSAVAEIEEDDNRNRVTTTSIVLSSASSRSSAEPDTYTRVAEKCPNYSKMALDDLKRIASDFGLRTNTPRRLIEHQLKTIWEQTHKISKPKDSTCQDSDKVPSQKVSETLAIQLRDYIRSQPTLYEPILCYRVLDFESTYARICAAIPSCKKTMLRQFFDSEGIVYTSFHS